MIRISVILIFLGALFFGPLEIASSDVVHLKNKRNITGKVIDTQGPSVLLETSGVFVEFQRSDIEWILKGSEEEITQKRMAAVHFDAGQSLIMDKRYEEAAGEYEKAADLEPEDPGILNNLGTAYAGAKDFSKAVIAYQKALELKPEDKVIAVNLTQAYIESGNYAKAGQLLRKMGAASSKEASFLSAWGLVLYKRGVYTSSMKAYQKALSLEDVSSNEKSDIYNNIGADYAALGQPKKAKEAYLKAMEYQPGHLKAKHNLELIEKMK